MTEWQKQQTYWNKKNSQKLAGVLLLSILCGLTLGGCDNFFDKVADLLRINGKDAEAQANRERDRVQTASVTLSEFRIRVDNDTDPSPDAMVQEGVIEFTMQSGGEILGTTSGITFNELRAGDRVILQTSSGENATITVVLTMQ